MIFTLTIVHSIIILVLVILCCWIFPRKTFKYLKDHCKKKTKHLIEDEKETNEVLKYLDEINKEYEQIT